MGINTYGIRQEIYGTGDIGNAIFNAKSSSSPTPTPTPTPKRTVNYEGTLPLTFDSNGEAVSSYEITGNMTRTGTPMQIVLN